MVRTSLRQKYENLRIRYLKLQSRYYLLRAKMLKGAEPNPLDKETVSKKTYLELLAKLRRCQTRELELRQKMAEES